MTSRTIPVPSANHIENATFAIKQTIVRCGLGNSTGAEQLLAEVAAVQAQLQAEVDWLRGIVHDPSDLSWKVGERREVTNPDIVLDSNKPSYIVRTL